MVAFVEAELRTRVDYVVAEQIGISGRRHSHWLLSAHGLQDLRKTLQVWLFHRAGYCRVLPFARGAAYYISRYFAHGDHRWDIRIGDSKQSSATVTVGKIDVARSASLPKSFFSTSGISKHLVAFDEKKLGDEAAASYTAILNDFLDYLMPISPGSYWKISCFLLRKIVGCQKTSDEISLTQIQGGTGLSRDTVVAGLKYWKEVGLVRRVGRPGVRGLCDGR